MPQHAATRPPTNRCASGDRGPRATAPASANGTISPASGRRVRTESRCLPSIGLEPVDLCFPRFWFALAVLTRETIAPFAVSRVAVRLGLHDPGRLHTGSRRARVGGVRRRSRLRRAGRPAPRRLVVMLWINQPTQEVGHERGWILPLHGIWSWWPFDGDHWLIVSPSRFPLSPPGRARLPFSGVGRASYRPGFCSQRPSLRGWLPRAVYIDDSAASRAWWASSLLRCTACRRGGALRAVALSWRRALLPSRSGGTCSRRPPGGEWVPSITT